MKIKKLWKFNKNETINMATTFIAALCLFISLPTAVWLRQDTTMESVSLAVKSAGAKSGVSTVYAFVSSDNQSEQFVDAKAEVAMSHYKDWSFVDTISNKEYRAYLSNENASPLIWKDGKSDTKTDVLTVPNGNANGSYFGFKLKFNQSWEKPKDDKAIYISEKLADIFIGNSIAASYSDLIGKSIPCDSWWKGKTTTASRQITGIIENDSVGIFGEMHSQVFAFAMDSQYLPHQYGNAALCFTFGKDEIANRTILRSLWPLLSSKENHINFYDLKNGSPVVSSINQTYAKSESFYSSSSTIKAVSWILSIIFIFILIFQALSFSEKIAFLKFHTSLSEYPFIASGSLAGIIALIIFYALNGTTRMGFELPTMNVMTMIGFFASEVLVYAFFKISISIKKEKQTEDAKPLDGPISFPASTSEKSETWGYIQSGTVGIDSVSVAKNDTTMPNPWIHHIWAKHNVVFFLKLAAILLLGSVSWYFLFRGSASNHINYKYSFFTAAFGSIITVVYLLINKCLHGFRNKLDKDVLIADVAFANIISTISVPLISLLVKWNPLSLPNQVFFNSWAVKSWLAMAIISIATILVIIIVDNSEARKKKC
jgi:hypothetical protein